MGLLRAANREIKHRKEEFVAREQERIREEMARREMAMTNAALQQDQNKVDQLMKRFDSLLDEARERLSEKAARDAMAAAHEAGMIVNRSLPSAQPTMVAATHLARFRDAYDNIMSVRVAKQKGFVDAMYQTEKSHVPVADDPPIVYPDAEVWKELSARRKEKYSALGTLAPQPGRKEDRRSLEAADHHRFRGDAAEGRRRLPQGPAPHRDPTRCRGLERRERRGQPRRLRRTSRAFRSARA